MLDRPPLRVAIAVGVVAGCTLALQVLLTRLLAAVLFYHFAFFAISLALLGTGAGALLVYVRPNWFPMNAARCVMTRWSAVFAGLAVIAPYVLVRLDYTFENFEVTTGFAITLGIAGVLCALPFTAAGIVIATAIRRYVASVDRIYAFDLAGAGIGALAVVPVLWIVDVPTLLVSLAALGGIAALMFAPGTGNTRVIAGGALAVGLLATALASFTSVYDLPTDFGDNPDLRAVDDRWTPISRVTGYAPERNPKGDALVSYDQDLAPVPFHGDGGPLPDWQKMGLGPQSIAFGLVPGGRALIIGGGGGRDIYNALSSGEERVDVIELNRRMKEIVDGPLAQWSGRPYSLPGVSVAIGDGRSTLAARDTKYDAINIGFTNTLTAGSGSAYALSENTLYTVEAFQEYLDHLTDDGVLAISRLYRFAGDEALRATLVAERALEKEGADDPRRHIVVLLGKDTLQADFATVLIRKRPFTAEEVDAIEHLAEERTNGVAYAPGGPYQREWEELARATDIDAFCSGYRLNVCPTTDDKPFFLNSTRLRDLGEPLPEGSTFIARTPYVVLLVALGILLALAVLAFVVPLLMVRDRERPPLGSLTFFAAIGLGFLILEVVLIQRFVLFLGFPTYALSVVLFALLAFTGVGAYVSGRVKDPRATLIRALGAACVLMVLVAFGLQPLLRGLIDLPFALRVVLTVALLAPLGTLLGMAMPIGLKRLGALYPTGVPWAWGINGITSVLASALGVFIAISAGFTVATLAALACYVVALASAWRGRWPSSEALAGAGERPDREPIAVG